MKRTIILVLLTGVLASNTGNAQFIRSFGAKIAFTTADQRFEYTSFTLDTKRRTGFNAALFVEWLNLPFLSAITQVEYAQRGMGLEYVRTSESDPSASGSRFTEVNRVEYLSIPLLAKVRLPLGQVSPYLCLGPRFDFLLGHHSDDGMFDIIYKDLKKSVVGGTVAVGVETQAVLPVTLTLEARYNADFSDAYATQYLHIRNNAVDVWLGVGF